MQSHTELSVLIVSDANDMSIVLMTIFRAIDITNVTIVGSADVPEYDRFDLVLIEGVADFPRVLAVADRLRHARSGAGAHIVTLANADSGELRRSVEWGRIDAVMLKPLTISALTTQIERAIERAIRG